MMEAKPNLALRIIGWISAIFLLFGHFFRMMAWPGGAQGIIIGSMVFLLFYLPLWFLQNRSDKQDRTVKFLQFITLLFYVLTCLFKTMHWPGAGVLYYAFYWYTFIFIVPFAFYLLIRSGKNSLFKFHNILVIFFIVANTSSTIVRSVSGNVVKSMAQSSARVERSLERASIKNDYLINAFENIENKNENDFYRRAATARAMADSASRYVRHLRNYMISKLDGVTAEAADSVSIGDVWNNTNLDIPNQILVGDFNKLKTGKYSGLELKGVIEWFRDSTINLIGSENKEFIRSGINLSTDNNIEDGEPMSWVIYSFYNVPAMVSLAALAEIEFEIKNTETQLLSDLLNSATKMNGNNLAAKIADMGAKIENEARDQKIAMLQKESELSKLTLNAKNREIAETQQTMIVFLVGIIISVVLIFFVIRSNLIRKKINRELKTQKHLVEEKQKEILDSITYARRIQRSLLPTEKFIDRTITRMGEKKNGS